MRSPLYSARKRLFLKCLIAKNVCILLFVFLQMDQSVCVLSSNKSELNGNISGSCPDLSDEQLKLWDDILFQAVKNEREVSCCA